MAEPPYCRRHAVSLIKVARQGTTSYRCPSGGMSCAHSWSETAGAGEDDG